MSNTNISKHPGSVEIYWDKSDAPIAGWAYRLTWSDEDGNIDREETGALVGPVDEDPTPGELIGAACAELEGWGVGLGVYGPYEETSPGTAFRWTVRA